MTLVEIVLDARMANNSGIGEYIRCIVENMKGISLRLLVNKKDSEVFSGVTTATFNSPIYSISEQLLFFFVIPKSTIFWSPHYNIPIVPIRTGKRVTTIHDVYHLAHYSELSLFQKLYAKLMINAAVILSERIITVSEFSKKEIIKYCKCQPEKIVVIKNGVRQFPKIRDIRLVRINYKIPEKYLLFVGNVKPHKNLKKLLEAYILLPDDIRREYKVLIVGKKEGFITGDPRLYQWINKNEILKSCVIFTGFVNHVDMDTIYCHASLFIFPSLYEGFGMPPLEAMMNGCPVVASTYASIPEICGEAALYFDPMNTMDIKEKITNALEDGSLRNALISKGKEQIRKYTWEKSARDHLELFDLLV